MGPYCKFCDNRCFSHFPTGTPQYILAAYKTNNIIATCKSGQDFERASVGYDYDSILRHIEIVKNHTCAICHGSLDTGNAPIAEDDGYGKTIYLHPGCCPDTTGGAEDMWQTYQRLKERHDIYMQRNQPLTNFLCEVETK